MNTRREILGYSNYTTALLGLCLLSIGFYVYFLNMSVVHVVLQKETIREIQDLKNQIAVLESDYIESQHSIAARMANVEGLQAERNKVFVRRDTQNELVLNQ